MAKGYLFSVKKWGLVVEEMEASQEKQEAILTAYHLATVIFEYTTAIKVICNHQGKKWVRHRVVQSPPPERVVE